MAALASPAPPSLRHRRRARTRAEIAALALDFFDAEGYEATRVEAIAERALISPRTFYRYFPAKEELVLHGLPQTGGELRQLLRDLAEQPLYEALLQAALFLAEQLEADPDHRRRLALLQRVPQLGSRAAQRRASLEGACTEAIAERLAAAPGRRQAAQSLAAALAGAVDNAVRRWVSGGGRPALTRLVREALEVLRPAVEAAAGALESAP